MSIKPEIEGSGSIFDNVLLIVSLALVIAGIGGFYYAPEVPEFTDLVGAYLEVARWLLVIGSTVVAALVAYQTQFGKNAWSFIQGSRTELRKVVWPTTQDAWRITLIVMLVVFILGVFLWFLDMGLLKLTRFLTGRGG